MARRYWISGALFLIGPGAIALVLTKADLLWGSAAHLLVLAVMTVPITIRALRYRARMAEPIIPSKGN